MIANVQQFLSSGTWFKPGDATFVDVVIAGSASASWSTFSRHSGGTLVSQRIPAGDLPGEVKITILTEGSYAIITTHRSRSLTAGGGSGSVSVSQPGGGGGATRSWP